MNNIYNSDNTKRWGSLTHPKLCLVVKKKTQEQLQSVLALLSVWQEAERNKETSGGYERTEKRNTHS